MWMLCLFQSAPSLTHSTLGSWWHSCMCGEWDRHTDFPHYLFFYSVSLFRLLPLCPSFLFLKSSFCVPRMCLVRMRQEGRTGKYMCQYIVHSMWEDVEQRSKIMGVRCISSIHLWFIVQEANARPSPRGCMSVVSHTVSVIKNRDLKTRHVKTFPS